MVKVRDMGRDAVMADIPNVDWKRRARRSRLIGGRTLD